MRSWQDRAADVINFLESYFKDIKYRMYFGRKDDEWACIVEKVRSDGGSHDGTASFWLHVSGHDVDKLPDEMLKKAEDAVLAWQKEGFAQVQKQLEHWQHARAELDKRLKVNEEFERLKANVEKET